MSDMNTHNISATLNKYQKARMLFLLAATEIPQSNIYMSDVDILQLLFPLLWDVTPLVQQFATIALARLANHNDKIAEKLLKQHILFELLKNIEEQPESFKTAALFLLRTLVKHSFELTLTVISNGGLEAISLCLQDLDSNVREAAAWTIGYIARLNECLALAVVDIGAIPLLILYLQTSELRLIRSCASALCDISNHTSELAQAVVDAGAVSLLVVNLLKEDRKVKHDILLTLACIAKHSMELSQSIVQPQLFSEIFSYAKCIDNVVKKAATSLIKEISKYSFKLVECMVTERGIEYLTEVIDSPKTSIKLLAITALGYVAGSSNQIAMTIIEMKGVHSLSKILRSDYDICIFTVSVWTLGQIGKHSFKHANTIAETDVLTNILMLYNNALSSKNLKIKCQMTLKLVLQKCTKIEKLQGLLNNAPSNVIKYILNQILKVLPINYEARKLFATTGGLKKLQGIQAVPGSNLSEFMKVISCCYPEEIIRYYSRDYLSSILETLDEHEPNIPLDKVYEFFGTREEIRTHVTENNVILL